MPGAYLWGWCDDPAGWVKILVTPGGKLIIDPTEIFEEVPTDGEAGKAPTSNWAHDHDADPDAHHNQAHTLTSHTTKAHTELTGVTADQHHTKFTTTEHSAIGDAAPHHAKYTDGEAITAMGAKADDNPLHHDKAEEWGAAEHTAIGDAAPHHAKFIGAAGSYEGDSTVNRAIPHGLGVKPKLVLIAYEEGGLYRIYGELAHILYEKGSDTGFLPVTVPDATNFYVGNSSDYELSANL